MPFVITLLSSISSASASTVAFNNESLPDDEDKDCGCSLGDDGALVDKVAIFLCVRVFYVFDLFWFRCVFCDILLFICTFGIKSDPFEMCVC